MPRPLVVRMGSTPRWWCIWISTSGSLRCIWSTVVGGSRRYLLCDATCEVWFERDGQVVGSGRATRVINRRLRLVPSRRRHPTCAVPGCGATRGLHAHHIRHWEDGGPTELDEPRPVVSLSSPVASSGCHHHHRAGSPAHRHRQRGSGIERGIACRPPNRPPPAVAPDGGPPVSAPTGGGTTPSNPNHHRPTTKPLTRGRRVRPALGHSGIRWQYAQLTHSAN